ncbi:MAG: Zn-ribbon domain-containing OB-fold protein, partial [bacterium]|nr:Zn-ribbon domain-containing OB-fold protein [bacterium]
MGKKKEVDDRFKKFGTVSFTSITKTNDFIDFLEGGKVMGTRCKDCGHVFFPPRADCYKCLASNVEWFEVSGNGKLVTYSKLEFAPVGFQDDVPYCIALLDYGKYKIFGRIAKDVPED